MQLTESETRSVSASVAQTKSPRQRVSAAHARAAFDNFAADVGRPFGHLRYDPVLARISMRVRLGGSKYSELIPKDTD